LVSISFAKFVKGDYIDMMLVGFLNVTDAVFGFLSTWYGSVLVLAPLIALAVVLIAYCFLATKHLKNHQNAVTLRQVEKHIRDGNNTNDLLETLKERRNDIAVLFYIIARTHMDIKSVSGYLSYKSYKKINKKKKPALYILISIISTIMFACAMVVYGVYYGRHFNDIVWLEHIIPLASLTLFIAQFVVVVVFFFLTRRKIYMYWQEFKNLFGSIQSKSKTYWDDNKEDFQSFCKSVLDDIAPSEKSQHRVEGIIAKIIKKNSVYGYTSPLTGTKTSVHPVEVVTQPVNVSINNPSEGGNQSTQAMLQHMISMMQQNMQHTQMMQYNQMMQPIMQQNAIMLHNMQSQIAMQQNLLQRSVQPVKDVPIVIKTTDVKPIAQPENGNGATEEKKPYTSTPTRPGGLGDKEKSPDTPKDKDKTKDIKDEGAPSTKLKGKEISTTAFEKLNRYFKERNPQLYENLKPPTGPVVFLTPKREPSKIEQRLEKFFNAKVYKYTGEEWEKLRTDYSA
jgi:hypothetical protein